MKRIISLPRLVCLFALFLIFTANAVAEPPADHTTSEHGFMHAEDKDYPAQSHCTDCHGSDIRGGIGPSCYECHTDYWRVFDPAAVEPPLDHTITRRGVQHKPGHIDPLNSGCTLCHGENLDDGFAPSCFTCHGELWGGAGPPADHTELKGVIEAAHKPGFGTPIESECTICHGSELGGPPPNDDGFAPSCYSCHPRWWAGEGPPNDHTELRGGTAWHKPGTGDPFADGCTQCHGPNLNDGFAPSCYSCHTPPDAPHDFSARSWLDPADSSCTPCHDWAGNWNHTLSPTTNYTVTSTTDAIVGQPTGSSVKCLSCHEGNVAVDDFTGTLGGNTEFITGAAAFGTDLTVHHPVSFTYDATLAANHGALNDPATASSGLPAGGTIDQDMLDGGQVQCTSCHDPHDNTLGDFLLKTVAPGATTPGLCFTCHTIILPQGTVGKHHIPRRDDPWFSGQCTLCHGPDLLGAGDAPACTDCHGPFSFPDPPTTLPHHGGDRFDPYNECAQCHGVDLQGAPFGSITAPSCYTCHTDVWVLVNLPPLVDAGGPYTGIIGEPVALDASATFDPNLGDTLTYEWDFGDGSPSQSTGANPTAAKIYGIPNTFSGTVTVSDGVNAPVVEPFTVTITEPAPPPEVDDWTVTTTTNPPETFDITIEDHDGSLVVIKDDGVNPPSLAIGTELAGVIFWMDIWIDGSLGAFWGVGDVFFGNIDRSAGTMLGIVFEEEGGIVTFTGTKN